MFLLDIKDHIMLIVVETYSSLYVLLLELNALRLYCTSVEFLIEFGEKILGRNLVRFDGFVLKALFFLRYERSLEIFSESYLSSLTFADIQCIAGFRSNFC